MANTILIGCILGGTLLLSVFLYIAQIIVLTISIPKIKTESKGIKKLKFQKYNAIWNKYQSRKLRLKVKESKN